MRREYFLNIVVKVLFAIGIFTPNMIFASASENTEVGKWIAQNIILVIGFIVFVFVIILVANLARRLLILQSEQILEESGIPLKSHVDSEPEISLWQRLNERAWNLVPVSAEGSIDLGHDFDGIRELDNKLPPWWVGLFYGCIVYAGAYYYYYHWSGNGWSTEQEYLVEMEIGEELKSKYLDKMANAVNEKNVEVLDSAEDLAAGESVFKMSCGACHGMEGQGLVGPNLTDEYWVNGGGVKNIFETIKYGVPEKGMIAWNTQLRPQTMQQLASYILTLGGTNPPNPKAKEGKVYVPGESE